jgi:hypothetical protein
MQRAFRLMVKPDDLATRVLDAEGFAITIAVKTREGYKDIQIICWDDEDNDNHTISLFSDAVEVYTLAVPR